MRKPGENMQEHGMLECMGFGIGPDRGIYPGQKSPGNLTHRNAGTWE
jgi:hypothetical protein